MRFLPLAAALFLAACSPFERAAPGPQETAEVAIARGPFVSAANPMAAEAGMQVLRAGGSAVDAAVEYVSGCHPIVATHAPVG